MPITENPATPVVKFGFGASSFTGVLITEVKSESIGEQEEVRAAGEVQTILTWNKGISYTINALIDASAETPLTVHTVPKKGETFSFTPPQGTEVVLYCVSCSVALTDQAARLSIVGEKRDDVTFVVVT